MQIIVFGTRGEAIKCFPVDSGITDLMSENETLNGEFSYMPQILG
ncbi:MAG TPA: hypothetical protein VLD84_07840 [Nitrososphaeraceae archaeon]|nr:hypothetical protein [Nitrososphaeraceae archaeon]